MENTILEAITIGIGGALVLLGLAYKIVLHESRARIYRVQPLDNWYDKE